MALQGFRVTFKPALSVAAEKARFTPRPAIRQHSTLFSYGKHVRGLVAEFPIANKRADIGALTTGIGHGGRCAAFRCNA